MTCEFTPSAVPESSGHAAFRWTARLLLVLGVAMFVAVVGSRRASAETVPSMPSPPTVTELLAPVTDAIAPVTDAVPALAGVTPAVQQVTAAADALIAPVTNTITEVAQPVIETLPTLPIPSIPALPIPSIPAVPAVPTLPIEVPTTVPAAAPVPAVSTPEIAVPTAGIDRSEAVLLGLENTTIASPSDGVQTDASTPQLSTSSPTLPSGEPASGVTLAVPDCGTAGSHGGSDPVSTAAFLPLDAGRSLRSFGSPTTIADGLVVPIADRPPVAPD